MPQQVIGRRYLKGTFVTYQNQKLGVETLFQVPSAQYAEQDSFLNTLTVSQQVKYWMSYIPENWPEIMARELAES